MRIREQHLSTPLPLHSRVGTELIDSGSRRTVHGRNFKTETAIHSERCVAGVARDLGVFRGDWDATTSEKELACAGERRLAAFGKGLLLGVEVEGFGDGDDVVMLDVVPPLVDGWRRGGALGLGDRPGGVGSGIT